VFDKLFEIKMSNMADEILERAPEDRSLEYIAFVDQNRLLLDNLSEARKILVQSHFKEKFFRIALPVSLALTTFSCLAKPNERVEVLLINFPITVLLNSWVLKKGAESRYKSITKPFIDQFILRIESNAKKSNSACSGCEYYSDNIYLKCPVNPLLVDTEGALNCKDYKHKLES
jgi:hypothetical protein